MYYTGEVGICGVNLKIRPRAGVKEVRVESFEVRNKVGKSWKLTDNVRLVFSKSVSEVESRAGQLIEKIEIAKLTLVSLSYRDTIF